MLCLRDSNICKIIKKWFSKLCTQVKLIFLQAMGVQPFHGQGTQMLLWAGLQAAHEKITITGIPNHLNYHVFFIVHTLFTKVDASCIIQPSRLQVAAPHYYPSITVLLLHSITKAIKLPLVFGSPISAGRAVVIGIEQLFMQFLLILLVFTLLHFFLCKTCLCISYNTDTSCTQVKTTWIRLHPAAYRWLDTIFSIWNISLLTCRLTLSSWMVCNLEHRYQCFREISCLHLQGRSLIPHETKFKITGTPLTYTISTHAFSGWWTKVKTTCFQMYARFFLMWMKA